MTDCILYAPSFDSLVAYLRSMGSKYLITNEDDGTVSVGGFSRSTTTSKDGEVMVYARLPDECLAYWEAVPNVQVWGATKYEGKGTGDKVFQAVFDDEDIMAIYTRVHPIEPYTLDLGGEEILVTPPRKFGIVAGA